MSSLNSVDTGAVFKQPVQCLACDQAFYFMLRKIAEARKLTCPQCGLEINLADRAHQSLVSEAKEMIAAIDQRSPRLLQTNDSPALTTGLQRA
jgi:DNA-directed RNA polymerase subunit RPC12/RpoP